MKESMTNLQKSNMQSIKLGSLVTTLAHPYFLITSEENESLDNPKITAYDKSTPPLMVITEKRGGRKYNVETGVKEPSSYKCIYYSNKKGNYEEYWFQFYELKTIAQTQSCFSDKIEGGKSLKELKKNLIGQSVVLSTVALELDKKVLIQQGDENSNFFQQKSLLDFLPPVSTIIQVSTVEQPKRHDDKTGKPIFNKGEVLVKLRWFNSKTLKYSEEEVPLLALKKAESLPKVNNYEPGKTYIHNLDNNLGLEDNTEISIKAIPFTFQDIVFQHYRYLYRFKNLLDNTWFFDKEGKVSLKENNLMDFNSSFDNSNPLDPAISNTNDWERNWYKIGYLDKNYTYTQRIIYVTEIVCTKSKKENIPVLIVANCLLRKGKVRHFRLEGIINSQNVSEDFKELFILEKTLQSVNS